MTWVLIILVATSSGAINTTAVEFESLVGCQEAAETIRGWQNPSYRLGPHTINTGCFVQKEG